MIYPCPTCKTPVDFAQAPWRPFCSERCKTLDLGAWSSESYRIPAAPEEETGEGWSETEGLRH